MSSDDVIVITSISSIVLLLV